MEPHDLLTALGIIVGLVGIVLVVTPGLMIELASIFVWAVIEGTTIGWVAALLCLGMAGAATYLKYQRPGRRLSQAGVPLARLWLAAAIAVIGFFVIPVIGAPIGFVVTIFALALAREGRGRAWPATKAALIAIAHSVGIELAAGTAIALI